MKRLSEMHGDLLSPVMMRALAVGALVAAVVIIHCLALAAVIFKGPLLPYAVQGAGMMVFGAMVFCLLIGTTSSFSGMLACPQEIPATAIAALGAAVAAGSGLGPDAAFTTMVVLLLLSGVITGLLFFAVGHFRLASFFRFIPYPVAGGFFAGTGCVLVLVSLSVMSGEAVDWRTLPRLLDAELAWRWVPGAVYGLVLVIVMNRGGSFMAMMGSVALVATLYHLGLLFLDVPVEEAQAQGLLMSGMAREGALWPAFSVDALALVDWGLVASRLPELLAVTLVTFLCLLVYVNGLEVATGAEIDLNREFRVAGVANVLAGLGGSAPGCQSFVMTLPCRRLDVDTPWIGVVVAAILGMSLFYSNGVLELLPMSVIGGVLFFIGGDLLHTWLIRARTRLPATEYVIIVLIGAAIAAFGFIEGVGVGILATLVVFAFRVSRIDVVHEEFTGRERSSTKVRSIPDRVILLDRGASLHAYMLRGYIFFGSAHRLVERLRQPIRNGARPGVVLLDFAAVSGCDFSAIDVLCQFARSAKAAGSTVLICEASEQLQAHLRQHLAADEEGVLRFEMDLDHGLETGEDAVLAAALEEHAQAGDTARSALLHRVDDDLTDHLDAQAAFEDLIERLEPWIEPREFGKGDLLVESGEFAEGAHFLVAGEVSVQDPSGRRLYQCAPGDVIEPWAALSEQAAVHAATARTPCRTMVLAANGIESLQNEDGELAQELFAFLLRHRSKLGNS
ncbi:MAG: STAS domain-containing protein [Boseongicola sp. SB0675_bin_26]|nr:STAS domain-containing protein [Boseongicola sp. SB0675_bin_26]